MTSTGLGHDGTAHLQQNPDSKSSEDKISTVCGLRTDLGAALQWGDVRAFSRHYIRKFLVQNVSGHALNVSFATWSADEKVSLSVQSDNDNMHSGKNELDPCSEECNEQLNEINVLEAHVPLLVGPGESRFMFVLLHVDEEAFPVPDPPLQGNSSSLLKRAQRFRSLTGGISVAVKSARDGADQGQWNAPLQARATRPLLHFDQRDVVLSECVPGKSYSRDITLWNVSEASTKFSLAIQRTTSSLVPAPTIQLLDYESGQPYVFGSLGSLQHTTFRLIAVPHDVGEFEATITAIDDCGQRTTISLSIQAGEDDNIEPLIAVDCEALNLGQCLTGSMLQRPIMLKNVSGETLNVRLSSDRTQEVSFSLPSMAKSSTSARSSGFHTLAGPSSSIHSQTDSEDDSVEDSEDEEEQGAEDSHTKPDNSSDGDASYSELDEDILSGRQSRVSGTSNSATSKDAHHSEGETGADTPEGTCDSDSILHGLTPRSGKSHPNTPTKTIDPVPSLASAIEGTVASTDDQSQGSVSASDLHTIRGVDSASYVHDAIEESSTGVGASSVHFSKVEEDANVEIGPKRSHHSRRVIGRLRSREKEGMEECILRPGQKQEVMIKFRPDASLSTARSSSSGNAAAANPHSSMGNIASNSFPTVQQRLRQRNFVVVLKVLSAEHVATEDTGNVAGGHLSLVRSLRHIHCEAQVCTSVVIASPIDIHLGDVAVGTSAAAKLKVSNISDLPTQVSLQFRSKVLSVEGSLGPILLPAQGNHDFSLRLIPVRVNPDYRKQISILNHRNPENEVLVHVHARNIDRDRVALHSVFYSLTGSNSFGNIIEAGATAVGSSIMRSITVRNVSSHPVTIEMRSKDPENVRLYSSKYLTPTSVVAEPQTPNLQPVSIGVKQTAVKSLNSLSQANNIVAARQISQEVRDHALDLAIPYIHSSQQKSKEFSAASKESTALDFSGELPLDSTENDLTSTSPAIVRPLTTEEFKVELSRLLASYASGLPGLKAPFFDGPNEEASWVRFQQKRSSELESFIRSHCVGLRNMTLQPGAEATVIIVLTPQAKAGGLLSMDGRPHTLMTSVSIRLSRFHLPTLLAAIEQTSSHDSEAALLLSELLAGQSNEFDQKLLSTIPERKLLVKYQACAAKLSVPQKYLSLGNLETGAASKLHSLRVCNTSSIALPYCLRLTGRYASEAISFQHNLSHGVVPPFSCISINFLCNPKLAGDFHEIVYIHNVLNARDTVEVHLKATVTRKQTFSIAAPSILDFGVLSERGSETPLKFAISNISSQPRNIHISTVWDHFPTSPLMSERDSQLESTMPTCVFKVEYGAEGATVVASLHERVEKLEHKLRIYIRKRKDKKARKARDMLSALKAALSGEAPPPPSDSGPSNSDSETSDSEGEDDSIKQRKLKLRNKRDGGFSIVVNSDVTCGVSVSVLPHWEANLTRQTLSGRFILNEAGNKDSVQSVPFCLVLPETQQGQNRSNVSEVPAGLRGFGLPSQPKTVFSSLQEVDENELKVGASVITSKHALCGETAESKLVIQNRFDEFHGGKPLKFVVLSHVDVDSRQRIPAVVLTPRQGELAPGAEMTIRVTCIPSAEGKSCVQVIVRNLTQQREEAVTWNIHSKIKAKTLSSAHSLAVQGTQLSERIHLLDFGLCVLDATIISRKATKPLKILPITLLSRSLSSLRVNFRSNVSTQLSVAEDKEGLHNITKIEIPPYGKRDVYIALFQSALQTVSDVSKNSASSGAGSAAAQLLETYQSGALRKLQGGLTISYSELSDEDSSKEITVKIEAELGMSVMDISCPHRLVVCSPSSSYVSTLDCERQRLRSQVDEDAFFGEMTVTLSNRSKGIPLAWKFDPQNGVVCEPSEGNLLGFSGAGRISHASSDVKGVSSQTVKLQFQTQQNTLSACRVRFINLSSGGTGAIHGIDVSLLSLVHSNLVRSAPTTRPALGNKVISSVSWFPPVATSAVSLPLVDAKTVVLPHLLQPQSSSSDFPHAFTERLLRLNSPISKRLFQDELVPSGLKGRWVLPLVSGPLCFAHSSQPDPVTDEVAQLTVLSRSSNTSIGPGSSRLFSLPRPNLESKLQEQFMISGTKSGAFSTSSMELMLAGNAFQLKNETCIHVSALPMSMNALVGSGNAESTSGAHDRHTEVDHSTTTGGYHCNSLLGALFLLEIPHTLLNEFGEGVLEIPQQPFPIVSAVCAKFTCTTVGLAIEPQCIQLGKLGHSNNWEDAGFELTVKAEAACSSVLVPLIFPSRYLDCNNHDDGFSLDVEGAQQVPSPLWALISSQEQHFHASLLGRGNPISSRASSRSSHSKAEPVLHSKFSFSPDNWRCIFLPSNIKSVTFHGRVHCRSLWESNRRGKLELPLKFLDVTSAQLHVEPAIEECNVVAASLCVTLTEAALQLGRLKDGNIDFDKVDVPMHNPSSKDAWFTIRSKHADIISVEFKVIPEASIHGMITLVLLQRHSDTPLAALSITPSDAVDIRVRLRQTSGGGSLTVPKAMINTVCRLGTLRIVASEQANHGLDDGDTKQGGMQEEFSIDVPIIGRLVQGSFFQVNTVASIDSVSRDIGGNVIDHGDNSKSASTVCLERSTDNSWLFCSTIEVKSVISKTQCLSFCVDQPSIGSGRQARSLKHASDVEHAVDPSSISIEPKTSLLEPLSSCTVSITCSASKLPRGFSSTIARLMIYSDEGGAAIELGVRIRLPRGEEGRINNPEELLEDVDAAEQGRPGSEASDPHAKSKQVTSLPLPEQQEDFVPKSEDTISNINLESLDAGTVHSQLSPQKLVAEDTSKITNPESQVRDGIASAPNDVSEESGLMSRAKSLEGTHVKREGDASSTVLKGAVQDQGISPQCIRMRIRGCSESESMDGGGRRYTLHAGTALQGDETVEYNLTLELSYVTDSQASQSKGVAVEKTSISGVEFSVSVLGSEVDWIRVSRQSGYLSSSVGELANLSLRLGTSELGSFSSYILLSHDGDPSDLHLIRVTLDVVPASVPSNESSSLDILKASNDQRNSLFTVLADGSVDVMSVGEVLCGSTYQSRGITIRNSADTTLEFLLSSAPLNRSVPVDIAFSLSGTHLKSVRSITVPPGDSAHVYVYLQLSDTQGPLELDIHVRCRLVRHQQRSIRLHGTAVTGLLSLRTIGSTVDSSTVFHASSRASSSNQSTHGSSSSHQSASVLTVWPESVEYGINCCREADSLGSQGVSQQEQFLSRFFPLEQTTDGSGSVRFEDSLSLSIPPPVPSASTQILRDEAVHPVDSKGSLALSKQIPQAAFLVYFPSIFFKYEVLVNSVHDRSQLVNAGSEAELRGTGSIMSKFVPVAGVPLTADLKLYRVPYYGTDSVKLVISPVHMAIKSRWKQLMAVRYTEERAQLYVASSMAQRFHLPLRLAAGKAVAFHAAPGSRGSMQILDLEERALKLLQMLSNLLSLWQKERSVLPTPAGFSQTSDQSSLNVVCNEGLTNYKGKVGMDHLNEDVNSMEIRVSVTMLQLHCMVDELKHYAQRHHVGHFAFQIAALIFGHVIKLAHEICAAQAKCQPASSIPSLSSRGSLSPALSMPAWLPVAIKQADWFCGFFPGRTWSQELQPIKDGLVTLPKTLLSVVRDLPHRDSASFTSRMMASQAF